MSATGTTFHTRHILIVVMVMCSTIAMFLASATSVWTQNTKFEENRYHAYELEGVHGDLLRKQLFSSVNLTSWAPKRASSVLELFASVYKNHPDTLEGGSSMKIDVRKTASGNAMIVQIRMLGLLDDSVSGQEFLGFVGLREDGWVLKSLWQRNLCARGEQAGLWTRKLCP